jgi:hypothetical protein
MERNQKRKGLGRDAREEWSSVYILKRGDLAAVTDLAGPKVTDCAKTVPPVARPSSELQGSSTLKTRRVNVLAREFMTTIRISSTPSALFSFYARSKEAGREGRERNVQHLNGQSPFETPTGTTSSGLAFWFVRPCTTARRAHYFSSHPPQILWKWSNSVSSPRLTDPTFC